MRSMNRVQLIGYVGHDPEITEFSTGTKVARFRVSTHLKMKERPEGTGDPYVTTWHTVKVWGNERIDRLVNELLKGSRVLVEGTIEYSNYTSKSGEKRSVAEIKAEHIMNLDR